MSPSGGRGWPSSLPGGRPAQPHGWTVLCPGRLVGRAVSTRGVKGGLKAACLLPAGAVTLPRGCVTESPGSGSDGPGSQPSGCVHGASVSRRAPAALSLQETLRGQQVGPAQAPARLGLREVLCGYVSESVGLCLTPSQPDAPGARRSHPRMGSRVGAQRSLPGDALQRHLPQGGGLRRLAVVPSSCHQR